MCGRTHRSQSGRRTTGNSRKTMIRSLKAGLRRLQADYVDLFMPHFPDEITPVAEILEAFDDLIGLISGQFLSLVA